MTIKINKQNKNFTNKTKNDKKAQKEAHMIYNAS